MLSVKMETLKKRVKYVTREDFMGVVRAMKEKNENIGEVGTLLREKQRITKDGLLIFHW